MSFDIQKLLKNQLPLEYLTDGMDSLDCVGIVPLKNIRQIDHAQAIYCLDEFFAKHSKNLDLLVWGNNSDIASVDTNFKIFIKLENRQLRVVKDENDESD